MYSVFNIIYIFFSCGLYTMAINVFTWRITTKRVHLFSCIIFSGWQLVRFSLKYVWNIQISRVCVCVCIYIYIYIYKIEIRNTEIYSSEVSVSSKMGYSLYNIVCSGWAQYWISCFGSNVHPDIFLHRKAHQSLLGKYLNLFTFG